MTRQSSDFFPFQRLGLARNPFGSLSMDEWAEVAILPRAVIDAAVLGRDHVQVLGEKGRGKTSALIGALAQLTPSIHDRRSSASPHKQGRENPVVAYERIPEDQRRFQTALDGLEVFLVDEAQRLAWWEWRRLFGAARRGLRLVIGSHADHTRSFARRGLRLVTVRLEETITAAHVAQLVERRIAYFRLAEDVEIPRVMPDGIAALLAWYGSDVRAMEALLYEVFQGLDAPGPVTAEALAQFLD